MRPTQCAAVWAWPKESGALPGHASRSDQRQSSIRNGRISVDFDGTKPAIVPFMNPSLPFSASLSLSCVPQENPSEVFVDERIEGR
jgi:hypothetical protein